LLFMLYWKAMKFLKMQEKLSQIMSGWTAIWKGVLKNCSDRPSIVQIWICILRPADSVAKQFCTNPHTHAPTHPHITYTHTWILWQNNSTQTHTPTHPHTHTYTYSHTRIL
jgi:hypothetical protein